MLRLKVLRSLENKLILQQKRCISSVTPLQAKIELYEGIEGLYTLTLNRPEAKNSLGHQLMRQLREQLDAFTDRQARCLLIRSAVDKTFCAGADLKASSVTFLLLRNMQSIACHDTAYMPYHSLKIFCLFDHRKEQQCHLKKEGSLSRCSVPPSVQLR